MMARNGVHYQPADREQATPTALRIVPRWWRGPEPDPADVARLYVQELRSEKDIAVLLSLSRARVAEVLRLQGIPRRPPGKPCPVDADTLRGMIQAGDTAAAIAKKFGVSHATASRWLAQAGLARPDPAIDVDRLQELYVEQRLTTREVAAEFGLDKARVVRALAAAGIPSRPRESRRPHGARAKVTDTKLAQVYQRPGMTIEKTARHFGVSDEYLRKRIAETKLTRRPGSFTSKTKWSPPALQAKAAELYTKGLTMREVAARLQVSTPTISHALHAAKVPVRRGGAPRPESQDPPRILIADLYNDPDIVALLRRHDVEIPDETDWTVTGAFHTYVSLPAPPALLRELYDDIGLAIHHIALLIGLGDLATHSALLQAGVTLRPSGGQSPWNRRRSSR